MSKILFDCDGVLCDFCLLVFDFIEKRTGVRWTHDQVTEWEVFKSLGCPELENEFKTAISQGGLVENMVCTPGSKPIVNHLKKNHNLVAVTAPYNVNCWVPERRKWLMNNFDFKKDDIIFTSGKQHVPGDVFIDDHPKNIKKWKKANPEGIALLWDAPWNRSTQLNDSVTRVYDWEHLLDEINE